MEYRETKLFPNFGVIVESLNDNMSLESIDKESLLSYLSSYGLVVCRGFESDRIKFSALIERCSRKVTQDPARSSSVKNAQLISAGDVAMGMHIENGNLPFLPDAQWFYCEQSANGGSQTTFCDGFEVLDLFNNDMKSIFTERKIQYSRIMNNMLWKRYLAVELDMNISDITEKQLEYVNDRVDGQNYIYNSFDGSVYSRYQTYAVKKNLFSGRLAFANSMLGPSVNYHPPTITWGDGSIIAPKIWDCITDKVETTTRDMDWHQGDVALVDNTRVMHGRRKIIDNNRRMLGGQSYLDI